MNKLGQRFDLGHALTLYVGEEVWIEFRTRGNRAAFEVASLVDEKHFNAPVLAQWVKDRQEEAWRGKQDVS